MTTASAIAQPGGPLERAGAVAPVADAQAFSLALTGADLQGAEQPQQPAFPALIPPSGARLAPPGLLIPDLGDVPSASAVTSGLPTDISAPSDTIASDIVKVQVSAATLSSSIGPMEGEQPAAAPEAGVGGEPEAMPPADPRAALAAGLQAKHPAGQATGRKPAAENSDQAKECQQDTGEPSGAMASDSGLPASDAVIPEAVPIQARAAHSGKRHGADKHEREEQSSPLTLPSAESGAAPPASQGVQPAGQAAKERQLSGDPGDGFSQPLAAAANTRAHMSASLELPSPDAASAQAPGEQGAPMPVRSDLPPPGLDKPQPGSFAVHSQHNQRTDVLPPALAQPAAAVISARQGIGKSLGVEIARTMASGQEQILVRLDPKDLGQLDIRLTFDPTGELRAVVTTTTTASADIIRQDLPTLLRGLSDAGVRVDDKSIRFELQSDTHSGSGQGQSYAGGQQSRRGTGGNEQQQEEEVVYAMRPWRAGGQFELRA